MAIRTFEQLVSKYIAACATQKELHITHSGNIHAYDPSQPLIYTDRVLENIVTHDLEIFYNGQSAGRDDKHLIKSIRQFNQGRNVLIKFYMRTINLGPLTEIGRITEAEQIQIRTAGPNQAEDHEINKFHFVIKRADRVNRPIPIVPDLLNTGPGCYKKMMLWDLGIIDYNLIPHPNKPGFNKSLMITENFNDERDYSIRNIMCHFNKGYGVFLRLDI